MTEIITDYLDAKQLADRLTALELHSTSELARLEQERNEARDAFVIATDQMVQAQCKLRESNTERDEAREKINRQANRIRYLEGATNHACGTPLSVALRERDEARQALMKIEDLFIDGTDIYADRENMGLIARSALEEAK